MYTRSDEDGLRNSVGFRQTFSIEVKIDFVGVWYARFSFTGLFTTGINLTIGTRSHLSD